MERGYKIIIPTSSVVNGKRVNINYDYIDGWAVCNPESDAVYYLPKEK